jgi:hypothetical protein
MLILSPLVACNPPESEPDGSGVVLEAFEAHSTSATEQYEGSVDEGTFGVTGGDRDWTLTGEDGAVVTVHAPGGSDFAGLDGQELAIELGSAWGDDTRPVLIESAEGVEFLAQTEESYGPAHDLYGASFARWGDELATGEVQDDYGAYTLSYREAVFETDTGDVVVLPGEPTEVVVGGQRWRLVVHASFKVTAYPEAMPGCGGGTDSTLSFEMRRLSAEPDLAVRAAAEGARLAGRHSCG